MTFQEKLLNRFGATKHVFLHQWGFILVFSLECIGVVLQSGQYILTVNRVIQADTKTRRKGKTMNRVSQITLGKLLAKIEAHGSLSKAVSIFWIEGLDRAGYHEHEIREHCEKLIFAETRNNYGK